MVVAGTETAMAEAPEVAAVEARSRGAVTSEAVAAASAEETIKSSITTIDLT